MTLESTKNLGLIGAVLMIISAVAFFFEPLLAILGVIGVILVLIALHGLADYYKEKGIFNNALIGFISLIVGGVVTFVAFVYLFFATSFGTSFISILYPGFNGDWTTLPSLTLNTNVDPNALVPYVGPILEVLAILWVFGIIASFFTWRSLKGLSSRSSVRLFSTAGILLLIGSLAAIVFGLGLILVWVAVLLVAVAFFQLKPQIDQPMAAAAYPPQPTTA